MTDMVTQIKAVLEDAVTYIESVPVSKSLADDLGWHNWPFDEEATEVASDLSTRIRNLLSDMP